MSKNWVKYNGNIPPQQIVMIDKKDKESQRILDSEKNKNVKKDNEKVEETE